MKRRDFIKIAGISAALLPVTPSVFGTQAVQPIPLRAHSYRLTYQVNFPEEGKKARLWLPLPDTDDTPHQFTQGSVWSGNADIAKFENIPGTSSPMFHAEWRGAGPRHVAVSSVVKTTDRFVDWRNYPDGASPPPPCLLR